MGLGKCWKLVEICNAVFQDMKSIGKKRFVKISMEKLWIFVWGNSKIS